MWYICNTCSIQLCDDAKMSAHFCIRERYNSWPDAIWYSSSLAAHWNTSTYTYCVDKINQNTGISHGSIIGFQKITVRSHTYFTLKYDSGWNLSEASVNQYKADGDTFLNCDGRWRHIFELWYNLWHGRDTDYTELKQANMT